MKTWITMSRPSRNLGARGAGGLVVLWTAACGALLAEGADPAAGSPPRARGRFVDPAVVTAGGVGCTSCGPGGCQRSHGGRHGHHAGCRDGVCAPYCPVRPQQFGYYGTRWRKWPGQEILQVSDERAAAPAQPPRSEVPRADEESLAPPDTAAAAPTDAGAPAALPPPPVEPAPMPAAPAQPEPLQPERSAEPADEPKLAPPAEPMPAAEPKPAAEPTPPAEPKPAAEPKPQPKSEAKPEPARPEDENLFEVLSGSGWRARRKFAATPPADADDSAAGVRPMSHTAPTGPRRVPKVSFDPAAETRSLRTMR